MIALTPSPRPLYVPPSFAGRCKRFPTPTAKGKEPLLLQYQARWVKDNSRLKIAEKSRQIGWTWASGYRLVSTKALKTARLDAWISSRDDIQAQLFLQDCKAFAKLLQIGADDLGERVVDGKNNNAYVLRLANGLAINSMSSNPDAQAGKRGDRVLDEFALHKDPRKLYSIAYPGITWGGSLEMFSTHRGSGNFFNSLVQEARGKNKRKMSLHRVTLQDALEQGFLYKLQSKLPEDDERIGMDEATYFDFIRAGCADEESFQQEYMCVPADDASAFIDYGLLDANAVDDWLRPLEQCTGELFVGVDVGRDHDLTVIWVDELVDGILWPRAVIEMRGERFAVQEARLYGVLELPGVRRCCIDSTGIGRQFAERAQERFGRYKVEAVHFTPAVKEELAYPLRAALEDRTRKIPREDKIISDFRAIRKETTASGNVRFAADRGKNGHADRFWAAGLSQHASKRTAAGYYAEVC